VSKLNFHYYCVCFRKKIVLKIIKKTEFKIKKHQVPSQLVDNVNIHVREKDTYVFSNEIYQFEALTYLNIARVCNPLTNDPTTFWLDDLKNNRDHRSRKIACGHCLKLIKDISDFFTFNFTLNQP
jgi:hypothetical protein